MGSTRDLGTRHVGIKKTFLLICIIQNMLPYYIWKTLNTNPLKSIIIKLTYIGNQTFNINGTMIHSSLVIPIHKNFNKFKALNDEGSDILI
jgi:hypothetical protein